MLCHGHGIFSGSNVTDLGIWIYLCHISVFADMISCLTWFCFQVHEVIDDSGQIYLWEAPSHAVFCQGGQNVTLEACESTQNKGIIQSWYDRDVCDYQIFTECPNLLLHIKICQYLKYCRKPLEGNSTYSKSSSRLSHVWSALSKSHWYM